jgi:cytochrome b involved in lipid metabolism
MTSHTLLFRVALVAIVLLVGYITIPGLITNKDASLTNEENDVTDSVSTTADVETKESDDDREVEDESEDQWDDKGDDSVGENPPDKVEVSTPIVVTNDAVVTPPPSIPQESLYTVSTVATHNSETSCWSIINGNVYDLTSFVGDHPGGERNILKICGKDGTSAFMGQHGGDSKPEKTLAGFLLGPLTE